MQTQEVYLMAKYYICDTCDWYKEIEGTPVNCCGNCSKYGLRYISFSQEEQNDFEAVIKTDGPDRAAYLIKKYSKNSQDKAHSHRSYFHSEYKQRCLQ